MKTESIERVTEVIPAPLLLPYDNLHHPPTYMYLGMYLTAYLTVHWAPWIRICFMPRRDLDLRMQKPLSAILKSRVLVTVSLFG